MRLKRIFVFALTLLLILPAFSVGVGAVETVDESKTVSTSRIEAENGAYWIENVYETTTASLTRSTNSKSGAKTATYYNSSGTAVFTVTVYGTFSYNGSSAWATSASATVDNDSSISTYVSKSCSYASNYATATGKVKYLGITIPRTVTLYCDKNGNLS